MKTSHCVWLASALLVGCAAAGEDSKDYTQFVSDGSGGIDTQNLTVTVTNTNEAPVITSNGGGATASVNVAENATAVTTVTATDADPGATLTYSIVGGFGGQGANVGTQNVYLVDPDKRTRTQEEIFQQISKGVGQFTGVNAFPAQPPTIGARFAGQPVQYVLKARSPVGRGRQIA